MVNGIDIFREHFNHFKEQYTVIGGFACDLLMNDAGLDFRQTVDIDMVLIVEALTTDFAKAFWAFIEAGGYQARQRSNGQPEFYRFVDPTNPAYPKMIEVLSEYIYAIYHFVLLYSSSLIGSPCFCRISSKHV